MSNIIEQRNNAEFDMAMGGVVRGTMESARISMAYYAALGAAAKVADEMAADLLADGDEGPFTAEQVINGYRKIGKLIRQKQMSCRMREPG